jgi:hypothetical protein
MATVLSDAEKTFNETFYRSLMGWSGEMLKLTTPMVDDVANKELVDVYGLGAWTSQSGLGDITSQDIRARGVSTNPEVVEIRLALTNKQVRDTDGVLVEQARAAANNFMEGVTDAFFAKFINAHSTAHPENGVSGSPYAANGGGTVYFADNFDMTFVNGGTATQANLFSVALGQTGLETLIAARVSYLDRSGLRASVPGEKPLLISGPTKMFAAQDYAGQQERLYNGSGLESAWGEWLGGRVTVPTMSGNNWGLVWVHQYSAYNQAGQAVTVRRCPVWVHLRMLPTFRIKEGDKANIVSVIGEAEYDVGYMPWEGDYFYSRP